MKYLCLRIFIYVNIGYEIPMFTYIYICIYCYAYYKLYIFCMYTYIHIFQTAK